MLPHRTFVHRKWECFMFRTTPTNLFSFAKQKQGQSNKIWALHLVPGAAAVAQKAESGGTVSKTSVNKQRRREQYSGREKRMDAEFFLSLLSENRFILTFLISFLLILHWIIWSFFPCARVFESERVNFLDLPYKKTSEAHFTHEILKKIDTRLWRFIFCMCFVCSSWHF